MGWFLNTPTPNRIQSAASISQNSELISTNNLALQSIQKFLNTQIARGEGLIGKKNSLVGTAAQLSFELEEAVKNLKQFDTQVAQSLDDFDEMTTCLIKLMQHFDTPRIFRKLKASSQEMADNADNVTRSLMTDLRTLATEYPVKVQKNIQTLDKAEGVLNANQGGRINTVVPNMQFRYY